MTILVILNERSAHPVPRTTVEIPDEAICNHHICKAIIDAEVGKGCWDMWTGNLLLPDGNPDPLTTVLPVN